MHSPIPYITGISEIQRKGKKAFAPALENDGTKKTIPVFISDRNKLLGVVLNIEDYEQLVTRSEQKEDQLWLSASATSLDFWNDSSYDEYAKLL